jgi:pseudaminic acid synthase
VIQPIEINGREISSKNTPYIIAEISANHNGSLENAMKLITEAKRCGADAVKLQTYTPDTITLNSDTKDFQIDDGLWKGHTLYSLYEKAHTPWAWHKPLFEHAKNLDISIFSTPFDRSAVTFLESLNTPAYKIASFEITDTDLISSVAATKKPMIISTGMADLEDIELAVRTAKESGCHNLVLLHCVSGYPAPASDYNLATMVDMSHRFRIPIGLSDHTISNTTAISAVALGATVIEKHFTLNRDGGGPDDSFSLEPSELTHLVQATKEAYSARGAINYAPKKSELSNLKFRRSIYFTRDQEAGEVITRDSIKSVRPGYGLSPKYFQQLLGQPLLLPAKAGTATTLQHFFNKESEGTIQC